MKPRTTHPRVPNIRHCAFSMVEMIFVIVIIGIVATIAAPRYESAIAQQHIDAAVRRVETDLALVQQRAKIASNATTIMFNVANDSYAITGMPDPNHPSKDYSVNLAQTPYEADIVLADFTESPDLTFDGYGFPQKEGSVVLRVGNTYRTITVRSTGGRTVDRGNNPLIIAAQTPVVK